MKNINDNILFILTFSVIVTMQIFAQNTNPVITNVAFSISGTTVTVTYDVSDDEDNSFTVYMEVSSDGGTTWDFDYGSATGAIGESVAEGTGKTITWEYTGGYGENFIVKILADDLFGDQIYYERQIYNTVTIGTQVWLKENLNVGKRIDGASDQTSADSDIEKYCYGDLESNCDTYGGLYQWNEAMGYSQSQGAQGICPSGWHIPTYDEINTLSTTVGNSSNALKAIGQGSGTGDGTNTSGFTALLGGRRDIDGTFVSLTQVTDYWSSRKSDTFGTLAYRMFLSGSNNTISKGYVKKIYGHSIRCIKD